MVLVYLRFLGVIVYSSDGLVHLGQYKNDVSIIARAFSNIVLQQGFIALTIMRFLHPCRVLVEDATAFGLQFGRGVNDDC